MNYLRITRLQGIVLVYGAGAMISQVLILRELMVLAQGQELKLALGLWAWLLWAGLGSLAGGRRHWPEAPGAGLGRLGGLLALLGLMLPATILAARSLPSLASLPLGQSLPLSTTFLLFVLLLAPVGLVSGYFFPGAVQVLAADSPQRAAGRAYYLETLGAALGVLLLQLFLVGRYANLSLGLAMGLGLALAPWLLARPRSLAARVALGLNLLVLAAAVLFAPRLEVASRSWEWPGRQVIATVDSPYALLSAHREAEQISFYANNLWQFTYPDPLTAEHQVHLGLLEHPQPRRVLLLGGGVAGLGAEILKTRTVTSLTYVELDPYLVRLAQGLAAGGGRSLARPPGPDHLPGRPPVFRDHGPPLRRHSPGPAGTQERPVEPLLYPGILPAGGRETVAGRGFQLWPHRGRDQSVAAPGGVSGHGLPHPEPGLPGGGGLSGRPGAVLRLHQRRCLGL